MKEASDKTGLLKKVVLITVLIGIFIFLGTLVKVFDRYYGSKTLVFEPITGYSFKDNIRLKESANHFAMETNRDFNILFDVDVERGQKSPNVNYIKNLLFAVAIPNVPKNAKVYFKSVKYGQNNIYIDYVFSKDGKEGIPVVPDQLQAIIDDDNSHLEYPDGKIPTKTIYSLISIAKPIDLLDIYVSERGKLRERIPLGRRVVGSPKTYREFKNNYTGMFEGILPCKEKGCSGIRFRLNLRSDNTFELAETYLGGSGVPQRKTGQWDISEDFAIMELFPLRTYLFIVDRHNLELMSKDARRISPNPPILAKEKKD